MGIGLLIFVTFLMGCVQITMFKGLPDSVKRFFAYSVLSALIVNFMLSGAIALFAGAGAVVGIGNLAGSVIFGIYLAVYKRKHQIGKMIWSYKYIIPTFYIEEGNPISDDWLW